jgi:hypothetical protein
MADDDKLFRITADISLFEIGSDISYLNINHNSPGYPRLLVNSSRVLPFFIVYSEGFCFSVAFKNNIVWAIFVGDMSFGTQGELFKTPEGIFMGMSYRDILKSYPRMKLIEIPGWAYIGRLPSGWKFGITTGSGATDYFPTSEEKVSIIYKD